MFCKKCGAELSVNAEICSACGFEINYSAKKFAEEKELSEINGQNENIQSADTDGISKKNKSKSKKKKALSIILPIVSVFLVASIVAGVVFFAYLNSPIMKLSKAFENTLFESSEINLTLTLDESVATYKSATANVTFGKGINGSRLEMKATSEKSLIDFFMKDTMSFTVENGVVYHGDEEKVVISEFIAEAKANGDEKEKLLASFLESLDKAIDGKLDKETMNTFVQNELLPYFEGADSEAPDMETIENALVEILKESIIEEAIIVEETKTDNGEKLDFDVDVNGVIDCMFALSEENKDVDALVQYITKCMAKGSDGRITDKESLHQYLDEAELLKNYEGFKFSITICDKRITEISVPGSFVLQIESK